MKKITLLLLIIIWSCAEDSKKETNSESATSLHTSIDCPEHLMSRKSNNLNISILLDLSSRIDVPNQQHKDSAYIATVAKVFNDHIKKKKLGLLKDKLQILFHPVPSNMAINNLSEQLKISYVKGVNKNEWMEKTESFYTKLPSQIYELARQDFQSKGDYPGSDIWRFFKDDVNDYAMDACYRNIVIILTDGYMYYDGTDMEDGNRTSYITPKYLKKLNLSTSDWKNKMEQKDYGFIVPNENLSDLEVLVIGIDPNNPSNPYAKDIIEMYWNQWFERMNVSKYKVKNADIPSNVEKVIDDFIQGA